MSVLYVFAIDAGCFKTSLNASIFINLLNEINIQVAFQGCEKCETLALCLLLNVIFLSLGLE